MKGYARAKRLVDTVNNGGISFDNPFLQTPEKRAIWSRVLGYNHVRTGKNNSEKPWTTVSECDPNQLNSALRREYKKAIVKVQNYEANNEISLQKSRDISLKIIELCQGNLFDVRPVFEPSDKQLHSFAWYMKMMREDGINLLELPYLERVRILRKEFGDKCLPSLNPRDVERTFIKMYFLDLDNYLY